MSACSYLILDEFKANAACQLQLKLFCEVPATESHYCT